MGSEKTEDPCPECGAYNEIRDGKLITVCNMLYPPTECSTCNREMLQVGRKLRDRLMESMNRELRNEFADEREG